MNVQEGRIIRDNPLRIIGVYSNASKKEIVANLGKLRAFAKTGKSLEFDSDFTTLLGPVNRSLETLEKASNDISLPKDKLHAGLFWFMQHTDNDKAAMDCLRAGDPNGAMAIIQQKGNYSSVVNMAVLALILKRWDIALYSYAYLLASDLRRGALIKAFTDTEDYFSEDELVDYISNKLIQDFPDAHWISQLQQDNVEFGEKAYPFKSRFADSILFVELTNKCVSHLKKEIDSVLKQASSVSKDDAKANLKMAELVEEKSKNSLKELRKVFGRGDKVYIEYADNVANQILDSCIEYYNHDADNPKRSRNVIKYTRYAYRAAESKTTKERAKRNLDILNDALEDLMPESIEEEYDAIDKLVLSYHANTQKYDYSERLIAIVEKVYSIVLSIKEKIGKDNKHYIYITSNFVKFVLQEIDNAINNSYQYISSGKEKHISILHWGRQIMDMLVKFDMDDKCHLEFDMLFTKIIDGLAAINKSKSSSANNSSNVSSSSESPLNSTNETPLNSTDTSRSTSKESSNNSKVSEPPKTSAGEKEEQNNNTVAEALSRVRTVINRISAFINDYPWWIIGLVIAILLIAFFGIIKGYAGMYVAFLFIGVGVGAIALFKLIIASDSGEGCAKVFVIAALAICCFILSFVFKSCNNMQIEEQKELAAFDNLVRDPSVYQCESFLEDYPKSERIEHVMNIYLICANKEGLLKLSNFYAKYANTPWGVKANIRRKAICDSLYKVASTVGTVSGWKDYQQTVPKIFLADSQQKIDSLENIRWKTDDLAWKAVLEDKTIDSYQKYLNLYPMGMHKKEANKKIIDAEVDSIMAGEHETLAELSQVSKGTGITSTVLVNNNTSYMLTLLYSGVDSKRLVLPPHETASITLKNGNYRVAASVTDTKIHNYAGMEILRGGGYSVEYYIYSSKIPRYK